MIVTTISKTNVLSQYEITLPLAQLQGNRDRFSIIIKNLLNECYGIIIANIEQCYEKIDVAYAFSDYSYKTYFGYTYNIAEKYEARLLKTSVAEFRVKELLGKMDRCNTYIITRDIRDRVTHAILYTVRLVIHIVEEE